MAGAATKAQQIEKAAGLVLIASAVLALAAANSGLAGSYHALLDFRFGPALPRIGVPTVHLWIADALMALFFLLVGLEVKREWYEGRLSTAAERRLPFIAAGAGMALPALVYVAVVRFDPALVHGWAIPAATDIAFAIGVLALLGARALPSIKLLLVTIAIIDDVGAVLIIALFYTGSLSTYALGGGLLIAGAMALLNVLGVRKLWPFLLLAVALWFAVLASGVHATIAGVVAALTIPLGRGEGHSPLRRLEHAIHPWVMFGGGMECAVEEFAGRLVRPLPLVPETAHQALSSPASSQSSPKISRASSSSPGTASPLPAKRSTIQPAIAESSEPASVPSFAASTSSGRPGKASPPMNRLIVKPIPHSRAAP
jgi:NhaA family Na+:H+ antiporter